MKAIGTLRFVTRPVSWMLLVIICAPSLTMAASNIFPHNVVVMISDGCGFNHIRAANCYQDGKAGLQRYQQTFTALAMSTFPAGSAYDPYQVYEDLNACKKGATDSAAAATAMATGAKTHNGVIGMDVNGDPLLNVVEAAEALSKATGIVTTVPLSHATPASFVVHVKSREDYETIASKMFRDSTVDVIMGTGHPLFDDDGKPLTIEVYGKKMTERCRYVGGINIWQALLAGEPMGDADGDGRPDPWTLVQNRAGVQELPNTLPKRVAAVLPAHETLQVRRSASKSDTKYDTPYTTPLLKTSPTLAEMTYGSLEVLKQDPDGFFLMVEGGAVDWASHSNQLGRMIEEQVDFHRAIDVVIDWVETNGGWEENLVVITADHECGYLCGPDSVTVCTPVKCCEKGNMPDAEWHSGGHTNQLVPFYVCGAGMHLFIDKATLVDPVIGAYLDNTDMGKALLELFKKQDKIESE